MTIQGVKQRFGIIGQSPELERALSTAIRVANTDLTILITGESGVGKEVFSKVIHSLSARKHNNFVVINCGAIPEGTINSELFGHVKGAFTGATADRKGYFETANEGTIFLDEIGEMPLDTQAFLLRILESGEYLRVGSSVVQTTDVRVIAATNVDLLDRIKKGKFREDLYYRLNTVPIEVPSLRHRPEDIPVLFRKFSVDIADRYRTQPVRLDDEAKQMLIRYPWPGNIRELKNIAEQVTILAEVKNVSASDLYAIAPKLRDNTHRLPAKIDANEGASSFEEREILYKLLFDMKNDLNDLKSVVRSLIQDNDLAITEDAPLSIDPVAHHPGRQVANRDFPTRPPAPEVRHTSDDDLVDADEERYDEAEIVDDNLSLVAMEKRLIEKALKKCQGRRRDAARELGISERTLYRKIKEYLIDG